MFTYDISDELRKQIPLLVKKDRKRAGQLQKKIGNPFKELFGFGRREKITRQQFVQTRELLESKRL